MGAFTPVSTTYGWYCTGGNSNQSITTASIRVKNFVFVPATGGNAVVMTDKNDNSVHKMAGATAATSYNDFFGDVGTRFDGLKVDLAEATDILYIHVV